MNDYITTWATLTAPQDHTRVLLHPQDLKQGQPDRQHTRRPAWAISRNKQGSIIVDEKRHKQNSDIWPRDAVCTSAQYYSCIDNKTTGETTTAEKRTII